MSEIAAQSKYIPDTHDKWAWSLAIRGATDEEIADAFGVTVRTLHTWKFQRDDNNKAIRDAGGNKLLTNFGEALMASKKPADARVEHSLYTRCLGFDYTEEESIIETTKDNKPKPVKIRRIKKHVPPDTMACMYWLNNRSRASGEWSQHQDVNLNINNDTDMRNLTDEQLKALVASAPRQEQAKEG